jgi:spermidine/putrescine transport system permease protein
MNRALRLDWLGAYAIFFVALLYGPVLLLPMFSFNDNIYITFPLKGFTTRWYEEMATNPALMAALRNSLKVGISVAIVSTVLGLIAAKAVTRYRLPGKAPIVGTIMLPLVVPSIILGIALLVILRKVFVVDLSLWTIGAGHVLICMPFSMLVLIARLEGFDKSLEEASLDLGENAWRTFWRVTFPLALPGIVSSLLLSFTESLDEFVIAFFLSGNDATLPLFIWSQLRFPAKLPGVLALGSCILVLSFIIVVLADVVRRRGVQSSKPTAF